LSDFNTFSNLFHAFVVAEGHDSFIGNEENIKTNEKDEKQ